MPKFRILFKNRNFVLYSIGQAFSQFADRLVQIVLIGFVYKRWPGSTFHLAKIFFFTVIPAFFISPIAGVFVDRWNKKHVMIVSDMLRALMILLVPIFFIYRESVIPIYIIILLTFASACFFLPARLSVIPTLVSKENLLLANSASSITWVVAGIMGFSLGGFLAEAIGIRSSLYLNAIVYFLSALSFSLLVISMRKRNISGVVVNHTTEKIFSRKTFFHDLKEGFRTLFSDKKIRFVTIVFFILFSMVGALYIVSVVFVQETLQSMTKYVGLFSTCIFVGLLVGSYIYGKIGHKLPRVKTILTSVFLVGIFINVFAIALKLTKIFWLGGLATTFLGFFAAPIYVTANTIIHESIESKLRGRIFSYIGISMNLGFLIFMFISSILAEHISRFWILIAFGSGFAIFAVIGFIARFSKKFTFFS